jgi:hypothetical protein
VKYQVPKDVHTIYEKGKRYTVIDGIVEIPGEPVGWLKPVEDDAPDLASMKVDELKELCSQKGIEIPTGAKKSDIVVLLEQEAEA